MKVLSVVDGVGWSGTKEQVYLLALELSHHVDFHMALSFEYIKMVEKSSPYEVKFHFFEHHSRWKTKKGGKIFHKKQAKILFLKGRTGRKAFTGRKIYHSAYPFGDYDSVLREELSKSFLSTFITEKRTVQIGNDPYLLPRITVPKDIWSFFAILLRYL